MRDILDDLERLFFFIAMATDLNKQSLFKKKLVFYYIRSNKL